MFRMKTIVMIGKSNERTPTLVRQTTFRKSLKAQMLTSFKLTDNGISFIQVSSHLAIEYGELTYDADSVAEWAVDVFFPIEGDKSMDNKFAIGLALEDLVDLGVPVPDLGMC